MRTHTSVSRLQTLLIHALGGLLLLGSWPLSTHAAEVGEKERKRALQHYKDGEKALQKGDGERAERSYRSALEQDPAMPQALCGLGQVQMNRKDYAGALDSLERCKSAYHELDALLRRNQHETERRREEELRELRGTLSMLQGSTAKTTGSMGQIEQVQERIRELEQPRTSVAEEFRLPAPVSLALGAAHFRLGHRDEARKHYLEAVATDPGLGEAHNNLAVLFMQDGRLEEASAHLELAEKAGFQVHPQFRKDLEERRAARSR